MKRIVPIICLITIVLSGCTAVKKMKMGMSDNPFEGDPDSVQRGRTIYAANCASCHGVEGKGDGELGIDLSTSPANLQVVAREKSVNAIAMNTAYGKNKDMEAFLGMLTIDQVWDVSNYVSSLSGE